MILLSSHLPGEQPVSSEQYEVTPIECVAITDYWQGVASYWESDETIVNVEHDMEYSDRLVAELLDCPEPLCSHAYRVFLARYVRWEWAAWDAGLQYISTGQEVSEQASIGFCKITSAARVAPLTRSTWKLLEVDLNKAVRGPWHIHWPAIKHLHDYKPDPWTMLLRPELYVADPYAFAS